MIRFVFEKLLLGLSLLFAVPQIAMAQGSYLVVTLNTSTPGGFFSLPALSLSNTCPADYTRHYYKTDDAVGFFGTGADATLSMSLTSFSSGRVTDIFGLPSTHVDRGVCIIGLPSAISIRGPLALSASACSGSSPPPSPSGSASLSVGGPAMRLQQCMFSASSAGYAIVFPDGYMLAGYSENNGDYKSVAAGILGRNYLATSGTDAAQCSFTSGFGGSSGRFGTCYFNNAVAGSILPFSVNEQNGYVYVYSVGF